MDLLVRGVDVFYECLDHWDAGAPDDQHVLRWVVIEAVDHPERFSVGVDQRATDQILVEVLAFFQDERLARRVEFCPFVFSRCVRVVNAFEAYERAALVFPNRSDGHHGIAALALAADDGAGYKNSATRACRVALEFAFEAEDADDATG